MQAAGCTHEGARTSFAWTPLLRMPRLYEPALKLEYEQIVPAGGAQMALPVLKGVSWSVQRVICSRAFAPLSRLVSRMDAWTRKRNRARVSRSVQR